MEPVATLTAGARGLLIFVAAMTIWVLPAQASAAPADVVATHDYIQANYALAKASVALIGAGQAKIERLNTQLAHECPGEGAGSLENEASQPVSYEVAVALVSIAYGTDAGPIRTFIGQTKRLHWSDHAITAAAERYTNSLHDYATLPLPELCAEVASWSASGFQVIPATTTRSVAREQAIELEAIPSRLLAPYERGADASILARTEALEIKLEENEFLVGQVDWYQLVETLGLKP
jgi:hypothetical protein